MMIVISGTLSAAALTTAAGDDFPAVEKSTFSSAPHDDLTGRF